MNTEEFKQSGKDKLQEYGREGLAPLMELFNRYGKDIVHYVRHVSEGLEQGCRNLRDKQAPGEGPECDERLMVASWFEEGAKWARDLEHQLENRNTEDLLDFVETQGRQHPAALFATSLIAGSVFGVVGKEAYKYRPSPGASETYNQSGRNL